MADLDSILCPSCGSTALKQSEDGTLICHHCQSRFVPKRGKLVKGWWQEDESFKTLTATGECPICGKIRRADDSFRCKRCKRPFICLTHQDPDSFLCSECDAEIKAEKERVAELESQVANKKEREVRTAKLVRFGSSAGILGLLIQIAIYFIAHSSVGAAYIFCIALPMDVVWLALSIAAVVAGVTAIKNKTYISAGITLGSLSVAILLFFVNFVPMGEFVNEARASANATLANLAAGPSTRTPSPSTENLFTGDPQALLLGDMDLFLIYGGSYSGIKTEKTNNYIIQLRDESGEDGEAYIEATGRVTGWQIDFTGDNPNRVLNSVVLFVSPEGAARSISRQWEPWTWECIDSGECTRIYLELDRNVDYLAVVGSDGYLSIGIIDRNVRYYLWGGIDEGAGRYLFTELINNYLDKVQRIQNEMD